MLSNPVRLVLSLTHTPPPPPSHAHRYFYYAEALGASESIEDAGPINWKLCLILLMAWLLIFAIMAKGVKAQGKVGTGKTSVFMNGGNV